MNRCFEVSGTSHPKTNYRPIVVGSVQKVLRGTGSSLKFYMFDFTAAGKIVKHNPALISMPSTNFKSVDPLISISL